MNDIERETRDFVCGTADAVAVFYARLKLNGMDSEIACELAMEYMKIIFRTRGMTA